VANGRCVTPLLSKMRSRSNRCNWWS